jgi:hypothetical protein
MNSLYAVAAAIMGLQFITAALMLHDRIGDVIGTIQAII